MSIIKSIVELRIQMESIVEPRIQVILLALSKTKDRKSCQI